MLKLVLKNIIRGSMRNLFTLTGVAVSIALFVSLTSISTSMKKQLDQTMAFCKADIILQEKGAATPLASRIEDKILEKLKMMPEIKSISSLTVGSVGVTGQHADLPYLFMFGASTTEPFFSITEWIGTGIIEGRMFQPGKKEILLGRLAARRLQVGVGSILIIGNNERYTVSGIYWLDQGIIDGASIVDLESSQVLLKRKGYTNMVLVEARDKKKTAQLISRIQTQIQGVSAIPARSLYGQIRAVAMIDSFIGAVSASAMILGGLLVLNTLLMAVSERTREIGVLMAIGWSKGMILRLIVTEAVLLSTAGGILGYALSFPALKALVLLPSTGPGWILPTPASELFFVGLGVSFFIGGISSLYPAIRAMQMDPAVAFRYE